MPTFHLQQIGKHFLDDLRDQSSERRIARAIDDQLMQIPVYRDAYAKACEDTRIDQRILECLVLQQGLDEAARQREAAQCVPRAYLNEGGIREKFETVVSFAQEQMDELDDPVFLYRFVYVTNLELAVFQLKKAIAKREELRAAEAPLPERDEFLNQIGWIFPEPRFDRLERELSQLKAAPEPVDGKLNERKLSAIQTELDELSNTFRCNNERVTKIHAALSKPQAEYQNRYEGLDEALEQALSKESLAGLESSDGGATAYKQTLTDYLQTKLEPILEKWVEPAQ